MRLTGERPMEGATPDSLLALHSAGYREVAAAVAGTSGAPLPRIVVDIGCGVGEQTVKLPAGELVTGVDYDAPTAAAAARQWGAAPGTRRLRFTAMNGERLGLRSGSVDVVCSSHIIEHFTNPVRHVSEMARVLRDDGAAYVLTPNAPADFENPFHVYPFEPEHLQSMLELFFADVEILGLEADEVLKADFAARRVSGNRILRLDFLKLRHRMPRRWYVWIYERILPVVYRLLGSERSGIGSGMDDSHLFLAPTITPATPVLFAIARRPRRDALPSSIATPNRGS